MKISTFSDGTLKLGKIQTKVSQIRRGTTEVDDLSDCDNPSTLQV